MKEASKIIQTKVDKEFNRQVCELATEVTDKMHETLKTPITLNHQCRTENGIWDNDDVFTILEIIGHYDRLIIVNQYGQKYKINPNQIKQ